METKLLLGDCLEKLKELPDNSVDSIVTDPPYGLGKEPYALAMLQDWLETGHHEVKGKGFMGKEWDAFVPQPRVWRECLRVLKPGGHLLAFAGTRTQDLMCLGLRLAGFEIRDMVAWVYGSGFPKSLDVSKALDKMAGAEREVVGPSNRHSGTSKSEAPIGDLARYAGSGDVITAPATEAAKQWDGWGTALKPALEPITLARKPLDGTVAANVLKWHVGALNIDGCRVDKSEGDESGWSKTGSVESENRSMSGKNYAREAKPDAPGRFPANLIHDGSDEVLELFPETTSGSRKAGQGGNGNDGTIAFRGKPNLNNFATSSGSAARFFYCAKTSKKDRNDGCSELEDKQWAADGACVPERENRPFNPSKNNHPTVKPTDLMRYLCRLITPPGGIVLDPYMGSGSTGKAAMLEGNFSFIGIERDPDYFRIAETRITAAQATLASKPQPQPDLFDHE